MISGIIARLLRVARAQHSWALHRQHVSLSPTCIIDPSSSIYLFNPPSPPVPVVTIGDDSHVYAVFSLVTPRARISVGKRCQLGHSQLVSAERIDIGDDVIMSWGVTVLDSDNHSVYWSERRD